MWNNLLTSQALTFNLFGPFKQRPALATDRHAPPGARSGRRRHRGAVRTLARPRPPALHRRPHRFRRPAPLHDATGPPAFVAIEVKFSEAPAGIASPARPRYDALSREAGVYRDPDAPSLRYAPIEQFWREQLLVTAMLKAGDYDDGRLLVIAPALNTECQAAIARYRNELISDDPAETRFQAITLEDLVTAIGCAGAHAVAERISNRYLNLEPVHRALAETFRPAQSAA